MIDSIEKVVESATMFITLRYKDRFIVLESPRGGCMYTQKIDGDVEIDFSKSRPVGEFIQAEPPSLDQIRRKLLER